jgi:cytochrome P450
MTAEYPDLFGPATLDPYTVYDQLRAEPPRWDDRLGAWLIARYVDVSAALRDPRLMCAVPAPPDGIADDLDALIRFRCLVVNHRQGEGHARLRRLLQPLFAPAALAALRPRIQAIVDQLLDRVQHAGRMDVVADLTTPLAIGTSALIVGIPAADAAHIAALCDEVYYPWPDALDLGDAHMAVPDPQSITRRVVASLGELAAYLDDLATARRAAPADDVISALAGAVARGDLSQAELVANAGFVFVSGRHTTAHTIATAVLALLAFPDQFARLRADPALIGPLVEECLRYDGPSVSVARVAVAELAIGGAQIQPGQRVLPLLGSANHDPTHFSDPDRLDIERRQNAHLSFGAGIHYCVGAPVARLESAIALSALAARLSGLRAAPEPASWHEHPAYRLLDSLPVEWDPTGYAR